MVAYSGTGNILLSLIGRIPFSPVVHIELRVVLIE